MITKNLYTVEYRDSRMGDLRETEVLAEDEGEALDIAQEDYYYGSLLSITFEYVVEEKDFGKYE